MSQLTAKQVRDMDCQHQFIDAPMITDEVIKSQKTCIHCHTARLRYADGSVAYQLPLDTSKLAPNQVAALSCNHEFAEAPRPYSDMNIQSYKTCALCGTALIVYADNTIVYQLPVNIAPVRFKVEITSGVSIMTCGQEGEE